MAPPRSRDSAAMSKKNITQKCLTQRRFLITAQSRPTYCVSFTRHACRREHRRPRRTIPSPRCTFVVSELAKVIPTETRLPSSLWYQPGSLRLDSMQKSSVKDARKSLLQAITDVKVRIQECSRVASRAAALTFRHGKSACDRRFRGVASQE